MTEQFKRILSITARQYGLAQFDAQAVKALTPSEARLMQLRTQCETNRAAQARSHLMAA